MRTDNSEHKGYETTDAQLAPIVISLVVLVLLMVAGFIFGGLFQEIFVATEIRSRPEANSLAVREKVEGPLLQAHPEVELEAYLKKQRDIQTNYAWVDKERGKVRIPIQEAIAIIAAKGKLPEWTAVESKTGEASLEPAEVPAEATPETPEVTEEVSAERESAEVEGAEVPEAMPASATSAPATSAPASAPVAPASVPASSSATSAPAADEPSSAPATENSETEVHPGH